MTNLEANSDALQEILEMVNALPEAGGGGLNAVAGRYATNGAQTSRVTITHDFGKVPIGIIFARTSGSVPTTDTFVCYWFSGHNIITHRVLGSAVSVKKSTANIHEEITSNDYSVCSLNETTFQTPANLTGEYVWIVFGEEI